VYIEPESLTCAPGAFIPGTTGEKCRFPYKRSSKSRIVLRSSIFLTFLEGKLSINLRSVGLFLLLFAIPAVAHVATGIDVLEQQNFAPLKQIAARHGGHLRLGVLTNPVGIDAHEMRTIDVLRKDAAAAVPGLSVKVIFTAEHGINAAVDKFDIDNGTSIDSGLPIVSISGSTPAQKRPSASTTTCLSP